MIPIVYSALESGLNYASIREVYDLKPRTLDIFLKDAQCYEFKRLGSLETLILTHDIKKFMSTFRSKLISALLYPIVLILLAIFLLFFYSFKFGPSLIGMMSGYTNTSILWMQIYIMRLISIGSLLLLILISLLLLSMVLKDIRIIIYTYMSRFRAFKTIKESFTYVFAICFLYLVDLDLSTFDTIKELRSLKALSSVSWISYHLDASLQAGMDIKDIFTSQYFSNSFTLLMKQGVVSGNLNTSLMSYTSLAQVSIDQGIKRLSQIIKGVAYVIIIGVIALFYSGLFLPLKMMEGLL